MTAERAVFSATTAIRLIVVGGLAFACAGLILIFGDSVQTAGPSAYSYSAIGHRAFVETLRRLDVPVLVSRGDSVARADRSSLLVAAEPRTNEDARTRLASLLAAPNVLLVLPKRRGAPDPLRPRWVSATALLPIDDVEDVLHEAVREAEVRRIEGTPSWTVDAFAVQPTLTAPQLVTSPVIKPLIANDQGTLLGQVVGLDQRLWVLADPDLLSNHGIVRGDNATVAAAMIDRLRPAGGAVVFDETIHGFWRPPDLWRAMFGFPFVIPMLSLVAAVLVLLWGSVGRFGGAMPREPPLLPGKARLVQNTADLLVYGGHGRALLDRYMRATLRLAAARLRAPPQLTEAELVAWLDRCCAARGVSPTCSDLCRRAERAIAGAVDTPVLPVAGQLFRWKWELIHGPGRRPIGQRAP